MTETERSLLDAVLENPDDDLPRLVYADYLDENGDPMRAEFIRAQIAISKGEFGTPEVETAIKTIKQINDVDAQQFLTSQGISMANFCKCVAYTRSEGASFFAHLSFKNENIGVFWFKKGLIAGLSVSKKWYLHVWDQCSLLPIEKIGITDAYCDSEYGNDIYHILRVQESHFRIKYQSQYNDIFEHIFITCREAMIRLAEIIKSEIDVNNTTVPAYDI